MTTTKKPQDHKPKEVPFSEIEGHGLLIPFSKVKGSDQLRLLNRLKKLGVMGEETDADSIDIDDLDFDEVANLIDYVSEKFAVDSQKFDDFTLGQGGFERAMNLAVSYAGELGKGVS